MKTRLRVLRAERHWSQAELAKRVAVARATIVSIETRKYDPGLALAFKIARVFCKDHRRSIHLRSAASESRWTSGGSRGRT